MLFILVNDDVIVIYDKLLKFGFNLFVSVYNYLLNFLFKCMNIYLVFFLKKKMIVFFLYLSIYEEDIIY